MITAQPAATAALASQAEAGSPGCNRRPARASAPKRVVSGTSQAAMNGPARAAGMASSRASLTPRAAIWRRDAPRAASRAASGSRCIASSRTVTVTVAPAMTSRMSTPMSSWERATTSAVARLPSSAGSWVVTFAPFSAAELVSCAAAAPIRLPSAARPGTRRRLKSGCASQAADPTGTCPPAMTAALVTSGP